MNGLLLRLRHLYGALTEGCNTGRVASLRCPQQGRPIPCLLSVSIHSNTSRLERTLGKCGPWIAKVFELNQFIASRHVNFGSACTATQRLDNPVPCDTVNWLPSCAPSRTQKETIGRAILQTRVSKGRITPQKPAISPPEPKVAPRFNMMPGIVHAGPV